MVAPPGRVDMAIGPGASIGIWAGQGKLTRLSGIF